MNPFVKSKDVDLFGLKVEVREVGLKFLFLDEDKKADTILLLEMHTSLTKEEIERLNIDAFNQLTNAFFEINKEHFETKSESQDGEEGK